MADGIPSTPEMVERVARAILPQAWEPIMLRDMPGPQGGRRFGGWMQLEDRGASVEQAKAAIEAMREPTEGMIRAISVGCGATPECEFDLALARDRIRAMIDAALGEQH
jgi:hypothetical protein